MIILYDIPSKLEGKAWSPNPWKVRVALNYKGLDYKTEWIEYPDIEEHCKTLSIPFDPIEKKLDGSPQYTLPAIWDTTTGIKLSDSQRIIEYLDSNYPNTPPLFPDNTKGLQIAFEKAYKPNLGALWFNILPLIPNILNPRSAEYFYRTRSAMFGAPLETLIPTGAAYDGSWGKLKAGLDVINGWYEPTDGVGPYLMGDKLGWGDVMFVSYLSWVKNVWGVDDVKWKDVASWNEGRWGRLVEALEKYTEVK